VYLLIVTHFRNHLSVLTLQRFKVRHAILVVLKVDIHELILLFAIHIYSLLLELLSEHRDLAGVLMLLLHR
jgi:hypothetical protein